MSGQARENEAASISFGALVKAQATLGIRKRSTDDNGFNDEHKCLRKNKHSREFNNDEAMERKAGKKDTRDFSRTSKHAPAELSSKRAVSRKREVVRAHHLNYRDPRFETLSGAFDEQEFKKNYSFLNAYRDSEISELRSAVRKTKNTEAKENFKYALLRMESRKKAQEIKEQQKEVLRKHRKQEMEEIEQGKRPFYLKKAEQKKMALVERFEGMKAKHVDKVIERRRKKKVAKERKAMPVVRRGWSSDFTPFMPAAMSPAVMVRKLLNLSSLGFSSDL